MSLIELLRSARATWYSWGSQKRFYREGVPGMKHSGYEAGRRAKILAMRKKVVKLRKKYDAALADQNIEAVVALERKVRAIEGELDEFEASEASRKAEARERA